MWAQQKYNSATASFQVRLFIELFGRVCNHHVGGLHGKKSLSSRERLQISAAYAHHSCNLSWICSGSFPWPVTARLSLYFILHMNRERNEAPKLQKTLAPWLVNSTPLGNGGGGLKIEMQWYTMLPSEHPRKCAQKGNLANLWFKPLQKCHI